jgi:hypothetical protein
MVDRRDPEVNYMAGAQGGVTRGLRSRAASLEGLRCVREGALGRPSCHRSRASVTVKSLRKAAFGRGGDRSVQNTPECYGKDLGPHFF